MSYLLGLDGVRKNKKIDAVFTEKPSQLKKILDSGKAATCAGDNGAFNIWKDDKGLIRCTAMRYQRTIESLTNVTLKEAKLWMKDWLKQIGEI